MNLQHGSYDICLTEACWGDWICLYHVAGIQYMFYFLPFTMSCIRHIA